MTMTTATTTTRSRTSPAQPPDVGFRPLYDQFAEECAVGACLLSDDAAAEASDTTDPTDFYVPIHQEIMTAVVDLWRAGGGIDAHSVLTRMVELGHQPNPGDGAILVSLQANCPATRNIGRHLAVIRDRATRRRLVSIGLDLTATSADLTVPLEDTLDVVTGALRDAHNPLRAVQPPPTAAEILASTDPAFDWLITGFMERMERIIFTAAESAGKSTFERMLAAMAAAGIHPWTHEFITPIRVLIVDLENPMPKIRRALKPLMMRVYSAYQPKMGQTNVEQFDDDRLRICSRLEPLDLTKALDRRWMTELVQVCKPDLLITGPLYKMHRGEAKDDVAALALTDFFDSLRARFGCGLFLEAHSPKGEGGAEGRSLLPKGSQTWMGWTDQGVGFKRSKITADRLPRGLHHPHDILQWKQRDREAITWPDVICWGGDWPWTDAYMGRRSAPPVPQYGDRYPDPDPDQAF